MWWARAKVEGWNLVEFGLDLLHGGPLFLVLVEVQVGMVKVYLV
jgi:hypothetical protein